MHGPDGHTSSNLAMVSLLAGRWKSLLRKPVPTWGLKRERQWSSRAIARTTPALLALFSIVTVVAHQQQKQYPFKLPKAAWYQKTLPTFADAKSACQTTALANADFSDVEC